MEKIKIETLNDQQKALVAAAMAAKGVRFLPAQALRRALDPKSAGPVGAGARRKAKMSARSAEAAKKAAAAPAAKK